MKIIDRTEKRNSIVVLVNSLIQEAFGKGFKGNYDHAHHSLVDGPEGLKEVNSLRLVARKKFGFLCQYAGQLGSKFSPESDGSTIAVFPSYEYAAMKYAELYKQKTGKDVKIVLTDVINPVTNDALDIA